MNLDHFISSNIGLVHFLVSLLALLTGTMNLLMVKGTRLHRKVGYTYAVSMLLLNATAFMMYRLFGTWGMFHWAALISSLTLLLGMIPVMRKRPAKNYLSLHLSFMYWSVIGLYGALVAELMVRIPKAIMADGTPNYHFYNMTGIAIGVTMGLGAFFFIRLYPKWNKQFGNN